MYMYIKIYIIFIGLGLAGGRLRRHPRPGQAAAQLHSPASTCLCSSMNLCIPISMYLYYITDAITIMIINTTNIIINIISMIIIIIIASTRRGAPRPGMGPLSQNGRKQQSLCSAHTSVSLSLYIYIYI